MKFVTVWIALASLVLLSCGDTGSNTPPNDSDVTTTSPRPATTTTTSQPSSTTEAPISTTMTMSDDMEHDDMDDDMNHGGDDPSDDLTATPGSDADVVIEVVLTEFAFSPSEFVISEGTTVEFVLVNEGVIEHEFRLTTRHEAEEHLEGGHSDHHGDEPNLVLVAAGETVRWVVTFDAETEVDLVACLIPGHFEAGMLADLTLEG